MKIAEILKKFGDVNTAILRYGVQSLTSLSHPASPGLGQVIYEGDTGNLLVWNGKSWATAFQAAAWTSWTPTLANLTLGNGTMTAHYVQIGKTVHYWFEFILGSSSSVGVTGTTTLTLPVAANAGYATQHVIGDVALLDSGVAVWRGTLRATSATVGFINYYNASANQAAITTTVPWTWKTGDGIFISGTYEAA